MFISVTGLFDQSTKLDKISLVLTDLVNTYANLHSVKHLQDLLPLLQSNTVNSTVKLFFQDVHARTQILWHVFVNCEGMPAGHIYPCELAAKAMTVNSK